MRNSVRPQEDRVPEAVGACALAVLPMIFYFGIFLPFGFAQNDGLHTALWLANIAITALGAFRITRVAIGVVRDRACATWKRVACLLLVPVVWLYWWYVCVVFRLLLS